MVEREKDMRDQNNITERQFMDKASQCMDAADEQHVQDGGALQRASQAGYMRPQVAAIFERHLVEHADLWTDLANY